MTLSKSRSREGLREQRLEVCISGLFNPIKIC